jgi:hypothetical protein
MHLAKCAPCAEEWAALQRLAASAGALRAEAVSDATAAAIWARREAGAPVFRYLTRRMVAIIVACATSLVVVGAELRRATAPSAETLRVAALVEADTRELAAELARPMPSPNGVDDLVAAVKLLKAAGGSDRLWPSGGSQPDLRGEQAVAAANGPALARMRLGLSRECRIRPAMLAYSTQYRDVRELSRLLLAEGDAAASRGDLAAVVRAAVDAVRLGNAAANWGAVADAQVADACVRNGVWPLVRNLERLDAGQCLAAASGLTAEARRRPPISEAILRERLVQWKDLAQFPPQGWVGRWLLNPKRTELDLAGYQADWRREADKPQALRRPVSLRRGVWTSLMLPSLERAAYMHDAGTAHLRCLVAALRVRAYRLRRGTLPASLAEAGVPRDMRTDPYTGGELKYQPAAGAFLLYSVGPNLRDDGGIPLPENLAEPGDSPPGDIGVARYARSADGKPFRMNPDRVPNMLPDPDLTRTRQR